MDDAQHAGRAWLAAQAPGCGTWERGWHALPGSAGSTPGPCLPHAPQALEGLVREGLVRSIGTSNFGAKKLADILSYAQIPPAVCQVQR